MTKKFEKPKPNPKDRFCPCGHKLSMYNKSKWCNQCKRKGKKAEGD